MVTEAEMAVMLLYAKEFLGLLEAGRNKERSSLRGFGKSMACLT